MNTPPLAVFVGNLDLARILNMASISIRPAQAHTK